MRFWLVLCLLSFLQNCETDQQFFYTSTTPKCCGVNKILALNYTCIHDSNSTMYIQTVNTLRNFPDQTSACLEMLYDDRLEERYLVKINPITNHNEFINLNSFPKCCPNDLMYDTVEHKCVESTKVSSLVEEVFLGRLNEGIVVMKVGLGTCDTLIADYELPSVRNIIFDSKHGIYVPQLQKVVQYGNFCIEKIANSNRYVVRVCHSDFNVCKTKKSDRKKVRCVRKCCADGEVLQHRPSKCVKKFGHGLLLRNDSKIHYPDEPFAIVQGGYCVAYRGTEDDIYHMDVRGNIRLKVEDSPWLFLSPFKATYCYEYYGEEGEQCIFFCVR